MGGAGADIALESAQVVLMSLRLELLPDPIGIRRFCLRVFRQNVAFALAFKLLFLGLAARNLATLWLAVAADMGATLVVIFNGLRLFPGWCQRCLARRMYQVSFSSARVRIIQAGNIRMGIRYRLTRRIFQVSQTTSSGPLPCGSGGVGECRCCSTP